MRKTTDDLFAAVRQVRDAAEEVDAADSLAGDEALDEALASHIDTIRQLFDFKSAELAAARGGVWSKCDAWQKLRRMAAANPDRLEFVEQARDVARLLVMECDELLEQAHGPATLPRKFDPATRTALKAVRVPTAAMMIAGAARLQELREEPAADDYLFVARIFEAMIDTAIQE